MRFFGGSLAEWQRTPQRDLRALFRQVPVLSAEESLTRVTELAIGTGGVDRWERDRIMNAWQRAANAGQQRVASHTEMRDFARSIGAA